MSLLFNYKAAIAGARWVGGTLTASAFASQDKPVEWTTDNARIAPLFLNTDLRIADAHVAVGKAFQALQNLALSLMALLAHFWYNHTRDVVNSNDTA